MSSSCSAWKVFDNLQLFDLTKSSWNYITFAVFHFECLIFCTSPTFITKLLLRLLWFFRRTAALFRQIRTFPQLFRFCSDLGNSGIRQIVRNSMLTGRWWEGRILINLCGKNNVRNCDLLQSDFFARCRTVLGVAKGFFWHVAKLGKRWGPETLWFFTLEKHATKSHLPKIGWSKTLAALIKWLPSRTARYNFVSVKNTSLSQEYIIYSPPFGWAATPYSPAKRSDSASQKQAEMVKCFGNPP